MENAPGNRSRLCERTGADGTGLAAPLRLSVRDGSLADIRRLPQFAGFRGRIEGLSRRKVCGGALSDRISTPFSPPIPVGAVYDRAFFLRLPDRACSRLHGLERTDLTLSRKRRPMDAVQVHE